MVIISLILVQLKISFNWNALNFINYLLSFIIFFFFNFVYFKNNFQLLHLFQVFCHPKVITTSSSNNSLIILNSRMFCRLPNPVITKFDRSYQNTMFNVFICCFNQFVYAFHEKEEIILNRVIRLLIVVKRE